MQLPEYDAQPADEQREEAWNPPPPEYAASTVMRSLRPLGLIPEFCRHSAIILLRIPDLSSYTEDDFVIKDTSDGSTVFEIRATGSWSPGHKRALCDHSGRPLFGFRKAGTSYIAYNCNNERETLFTIESAGLLKPGYKITFSNRVSADGKREQWHAGGRWCSGTSKITTELGRVVASKDQDQFSWSKACQYHSPFASSSQNVITACHHRLFMADLCLARYRFTSLL